RNLAFRATRAFTHATGPPRSCAAGLARSAPLVAESCAAGLARARSATDGSGSTPSYLSQTELSAEARRDTHARRTQRPLNYWPVISHAPGRGSSLVWTRQIAATLAPSNSGVQQP